MPASSALRTAPVVCAVSDNYIICVPVRRKVLMSVTVGGRDYYCHSNGIRRSDVAVQKFVVPMKELDKAKAYTVTYEAVLNRTPKLCEKEPAVSVSFKFRPIRKRSGINIYHISDSHGLKNMAIKAGAYFGKYTSAPLDLLIMNGDISSQSDNKNDILIVYDIAAAITKGEIPCIVSRGNHDLRGRYAEKLEEFLPTDNGRTYYTVKLGPMWFVLLDCGEDKVDGHKEYSGTVCCHSFRTEQTEYLKALKKRAKTEYRAAKCRYRIVLSHVPFNMDNTDECKGERPFNIERELYSDWCSFLREEVKPDFMLAGHVHTLEVIKAGGEKDNKRLMRDTILGGAPLKENGAAVGFGGCALTLGEKSADVKFTDDKGRILGEDTIVFERKREE